MLVGEPGTAKSLLSELIAAAVSGDSTLTIQGGAATTEDQVGSVRELCTARRGRPLDSIDGSSADDAWNGRGTRRAVRGGHAVSARSAGHSVVVAVRTGAGSPGAFRETTQWSMPVRGFNVIATANTRDRGVNEMSAALKRRFNFETVHPIADFDTEVELVRTESAALLRASGVAAEQDPAVSELLVTLFRDLRASSPRTDRRSSDCHR